MAFSLRTLSFSRALSCLKRATCYEFLPSGFYISPISTLDVHLCGDESSCQSDEHWGSKPAARKMDEFQVLNQLSDLLPIRHVSDRIYNPYVPVPPKNHDESGIIVAHDGFLPMEDKLRGVFLQKLNGKTAIEKALTSAMADMDLTLDIVSKVVDRGNLGGEAMVVFFSWAIKQSTVEADVSTYHVILKALGRRKFFKFMVEKFQEMCKQGISPTCETLMIVMDSFVRARQVSKAINLFRKLEEFGLKCETRFFNVLLQCLCLRAYVSTANSLLNLTKGTVEFDTTTYNVIIGGWSTLGRVDKMEATLEEMVDHEFDPDSLTYSYLIQGFGKAGQIDNAVRIFQEMEDHDCPPNTGVYNSMISNFISVRNFGECMKYYQEMVNSDSDCLPNADTYTMLIGALLKARKVADALEIFEEMSNRQIVPSTGTVTSFIETMCSYGPPHAAMVIYKGARKVGCRISLKAYKLLLARLSRFGKCGMLLNMWHEMQESGCCSDAEVYESIINGLCNNGQLDSAVMVMEESFQKGFCPNRIVCGKLNNKLMTARKVDDAYRLFLKIKVARVKENARNYSRANGWHV